MGIICVVIDILNTNCVVLNPWGQRQVVRRVLLILILIYHPDVGMKPLEVHIEYFGLPRNYLLEGLELNFLLVFIEFEFFEDVVCIFFNERRNVVS